MYALNKKIFLKKLINFSYYLFRSWGRIGTTIGGVKTEDFEHELEDCKKRFKEYKYFF